MSTKFFTKNHQLTKPDSATVYEINTASGIKKILASNYQGYLAWPNTYVPYIDWDAITSPREKARIDKLIELAETNPLLCAKLWQDEKILSFTLRI
jgi:hypothetical protein